MVLFYIYIVPKRDWAIFIASQKTAIQYQHSIQIKSTFDRYPLLYVKHLINFPHIEGYILFTSSFPLVASTSAGG